ncbi:cytochrome b/b6 domain-containing protein [Corynebacterium aquatimens]
MVVMSARYITETTAWGSNFIERYDGRQPLPASAPEGFPWWLNWTHFLNMLLMVLIIRTGLTIRSEKRPEGYWTPKWNPKAKVSLNTWLHQALDVLWVLNGVIFFILLFATGQWMRIVPTSWETFPNAVSAGLQYLTLNWPEENGWVYYNSLQELAYFTTVFIAAPLALVSGFRMSSFWRESWTGANKILPAAAARKIHYPVMVYFVVFIAIHVALVVLTGVRSNLNHMFAAQSGDSWWGVIMFVLSMAVIAGAWFAAKPMIVAPLARMTGKVSNR